MNDFLSLLVVLLIFQDPVHSQFDWCKIQCNNPEETHNLCKNPECLPAPGCQLRSDITKDVKDFIVYRHNEIRNRFAKDRGVANMMAVSWDRETEYLAECWANQCMPNKQPHDTCAINSTGKVLGQNLYIAMPIQSAMQMAQKAVEEGWFLKELYYVPDDVWFSIRQDKTNFNKYGHITQLVWAETNLVGCAWSANVDGLNYLYCNYSPAGNVITRPVYEAGAPASKCPYGTKPNSIFSGLCGEIQLAYE